MLKLMKFLKENIKRKILTSDVFLEDSVKKQKKTKKYKIKPCHFYRFKKNNRKSHIFHIKNYLF